MDRKKTILIAVLVNAGLLAVLFIMALYTEEELPQSVSVSQGLQEKSPLFQDLKIEEPPSVKTEDLFAQAPIPVPELVHQLPPVAVKEAPVLPAAMPACAPQAALSPTAETTVKKGDTLEKIAKAHHTTIDEIVRLNQLTSSFLRIGQVLKLPAEKTQSTDLPKAMPAEKRPLETQQEYYIVKVGDNPWTVAMKHHLKVDELLKLNNLNEEKARRLKPGDRLRIR